MTYSSSVAFARQRYGAKGQNTASFRTKERTLGPVSSTIILVILACLLGLLYLTQVTKTNAYSYRIDSLKSQQTTLQAEHDQLEVDSARLQALERVKNSPVTQNLVSVNPSATIQN
jgi:outer membrane murein-binding lipoprotein Lpp